MKAYGSVSHMPKLLDIQSKIIKKEVFKLKPSISKDIVIFKESDLIKTYNLGEISFWVV